jgi:uncharacterized protein YciI
MADSWKFFVVEVTYRIPADQLGETLAAHRAFLQTGYDQGWLLLSGPQVPRTGGIIIARAPSRAAIEAFFLQDPYQHQQLADYRFVEFEPAKRAMLMEDWVTSPPGEA